MGRKQLANGFFVMESQNRYGFPFFVHSSTFCFAIVLMHLALVMKIMLIRRQIQLTCFQLTMTFYLIFKWWKRKLAHKNGKYL